MTCSDSVRKAGAMALVLVIGMAALAAWAPRAGAVPYEFDIWAGALSEPRAIAGVAMGDDNNIYIAGGVAVMTPGALNTLLIFNTTTMTTERGPDMTLGVAYAAAVKGNDGRIYVFGGYNWSSGESSSTQIYNPVTKSWSPGAVMPKSASWSAACVGPDSRIYVFGGFQGGAAGNSTLIYNTVTNSWSYGADLPNPRWSSAAVMTSPNAIMLVGGATYAGANNLVEAYNPVANSWSWGVNLTLPRASGGAALGRNGFMYYFAGTSDYVPNPSSANIRSDVERLDISDGISWQSSGWNQKCSFGTCADSYGRIFTVGGWDGSNVLADVRIRVVSDISGQYGIKITSPSDGSVVSDVVIVRAEIVNWLSSDPWNALITVDFLVDGILQESQTQGWGGTFSWDTTALPDGSTHKLTVRGYHWDGKVVEDSVTVMVWSDSVAERIAAMQLQLAGLQAALIAMGEGQTAAMDAMNVTLAALQLQLTTALTQLQAGLVAMGAGQTAAMAALNVTIADLQSQLDAFQTQLDAFQEQVDRVENKADTAGTYGIVTLVLVVIVVALLALMFMMARKKP